VTRHLIHIGYPKTGSNALRGWFERHPQIAFADGGIAGFRTVYDIAIGGAGPDPFVRCRVTSAEGLATPHNRVGRPTVDYAALDSAGMAAAQARVCAELHALFPTAAILIVTRGFRSLLLSSYSQYVRTGGGEGFAAFCGAEAERVWNYDRLIRLYESAFGPANVLVLPYEWLRDDPAAFLRALADRLGLDPAEHRVPTVNAGLSPAAMAWFPRFARLMPPRLFARAATWEALDALARRLQRVRPLPAPDEAAVPASVLRRFEGCAEGLRSRPAFAPYLSDYRLGEAGQGSGASEAPAG
jgi:hypothetical protein